MHLWGLLVASLDHVLSFKPERDHDSKIHTHTHIYKKQNKDKNKTKTKWILPADQVKVIL